MPATEETRGWVYYDSNNLYFGFYMRDSQPEKIYAELAPRDGYESNDSITVIIDTYSDQINCFEFTLNARGIQAGLATIWRGQAAKQADGWTAEIVIPFKSLRFEKKERLSFRINFIRYLHRLDETDYWTKVGRDDRLLEKSGVLEGLERIKWHYNFELFPYIGGRYGKWEDEHDGRLSAGLDLKYGLTSNLTFDFSVSPDFSEVEADPFIYQLSPYENFLSENRPFFYESSDFFSSYFDLFYSRRIEDIHFAGKLTGKIRGFSIGLLTARSSYYNEEGGLFSVVRLKKDIFRNSELGFIIPGIMTSGLPIIISVLTGESG